MATAVVKDVNLRIQFDDGVVDGKQKYLTKTVSGISKTATEDGIFQVAKLLEGLQTRPIYTVRKITTTELMP